MMHGYRTEFDLNALFIHLNSRKMHFNALKNITLRSKVDYIWPSAIRLCFVQSVQLSKIAKKTELRFMPIFLIERKHCSY